MNLGEIEKKVLEKIKPRREEYELLMKAYRKIESTIYKILEKHGVKAEVTLQGSVAHDTWLSGERDLDVFVLFPKEWSIEELRSRGFSILLEAAEEIGNYSIRYAEHPYVRVILDNVQADLVPAFKLNSPKEVRTAVDRTPFHTKYVNEHLDEELRDHVRLFKRFLKGLGIYGAEVKVKGFSGYLSELLIIKYGGFHDVISRAAEWKAPVFIDMIGDPGIFRVLRKKYPESVMYVPDPVDPARNVAAAVSLYSLATLVIASKCYRVNPCIEYYYPSTSSLEIDFSFIDNRCIVLVTLESSEFSKLPPDVLWGELHRVTDRAVKLAERFEFNVMDWSNWTDEERIAVIGLEVDECSKEYPKLYQGPPYYSSKRVLDFISKHVFKGSIGPWIRRDGLLLALGSRKYVSIRDLLIDRTWEYLVAPHFRGLTPRVYILGEDPFDVLKLMDRDWVVGFVFKRRDWINCCIR